ncbi:response regulator [Flavivirga spongiicola]|uniref:Response regulator n=1 Tax=Flavivirga spongiicola TaxID=421621 RepID=A0ABU7XYB1_9FLAO|nr:response regulator [Flavivirga sp. MEBiC05379]MDO5980785.1 response regulator [Flavivirga sp. MEBiC05379]
MNRNRAIENKVDCILLIDDDKATNFFNKLIIEKMNLAKQVYIAENGQKALEFLKLTVEGEYPQPNLIFLDINMPVMNGWEFLMEYKKLDVSKKDIKIVMLTTSSNPNDEKKAERIEEVSSFKKKPLSKPTVNKIFEDYFPIHST